MRGPKIDLLGRVSGDKEKVCRICMELYQCTHFETFPIMHHSTWAAPRCHHIIIRVRNTLHPERMLCTKLNQVKRHKHKASGGLIEVHVCMYPMKLNYGGLVKEQVITSHI